MAPGLPIILMTGHRDAEINARAKEAGSAEILDKPLRVRTLREALARPLRTGKSQLRPGALPPYFNGNEPMKT
jgi:FixJ family two-component response regulator